MKIYKYDLVWGHTDLELPTGSQILSFDIQYGVPRIWALVDPHPNIRKETRRFVLYGTGHEVAEDKYDLMFIGTALMDDGALVWHVFEVRGSARTPKVN